MTKFIWMNEINFSKFEGRIVKKEVWIGGGEREEDQAWIFVKGSF